MISEYTLRNAGPRTIYRPNAEVVIDNMDTEGRRVGRTENSDVPKNTQRKLAEEAVGHYLNILAGEK